MVYSLPVYKERRQPTNLIGRLVQAVFYLPPNDPLGTGRVPRKSISAGMGAYNNVFTPVQIALAGNVTKGDLVTQPLIPGP